MSLPGTEQAEDPLRALFSGRREWPRVSVSRRAVARGAGGSYDVALLDASRRGVLLLVEDPVFYEGGSDGVKRVERAFPDGVHLEMPDVDLELSAEVVRLLPYGADGLALGCGFGATLTDADAVLLGIRGAEIPGAQPGWPPLGGSRPPTRPQGLLLFTPNRPAVLGPVFVGHVTQREGRTAEAESAGSAAPARVARDLAEPVLHAAFRHGRRVLANAEARLIACGTSEAGRTLLRVHLL